MRLSFALSLLIGTLFCNAQSKKYWQQKADYKMEVSVDAKNYQYKGKQKLVYKNNSEDTLRKVYYHLYNNAFQPKSEMDCRLHRTMEFLGTLESRSVINLLLYYLM